MSYREQAQSCPHCLFHRNLWVYNTNLRLQELERQLTETRSVLLELAQRNNTIVLPSPVFLKK